MRGKKGKLDGGGRVMVAREKEPDLFRKDILLARRVVYDVRDSWVAAGSPLGLFCGTCVFGGNDEKPKWLWGVAELRETGCGGGMGCVMKGKTEATNRAGEGGDVCVRAGKT